MKKNRFEKRAACFCLACFRVLLSESLAEAKFTRRRQFSPLLTRISVDSLSPGGDSQCKSDGDARRLAFGCNLQILVSLRVFVKESYYSCPFRYRLVLCIKKFTNKKCPDTDTQKSPLGAEFKLEPHPHWSLLGRFNLNFPTTIHSSLLYGSTPRAAFINIYYVRHIYHMLP